MVLCTSHIEFIFILKKSLKIKQKCVKNEVGDDNLLLLLPKFRYWTSTSEGKVHAQVAPWGPPLLQQHICSLKVETCSSSV